MKKITLNDLNNLRTAPFLNEDQEITLLEAINEKILSCDWLTIGIMALNDEDAKNALKSILKKYKFINLKEFNHLKAYGNVFLKGNQKSGEVYIRSENGLGKGILLSCHYDDKSIPSITYGPFPLGLFYL